MAKGLSPTQRTLRAQRDMGRVCDIVERRLPRRPGMPFGLTKDFLGFIDIIALDPSRGIIGVQSCGSSFSEHRRKITEDCAHECIEWLNSGGKVELWGWRKVKVKRGGKAMVWKPRVEEITLESFEENGDG